MEKIVKKYRVEDIYKDLVIPDTWDTLEEFVEWYMTVARMPILVPHESEVIQSDDAAAICIFKKGAYQVEFYLQYPKLEILEHSHPDMEVIIVDLAGGNQGEKSFFGVSSRWGNTFSKLNNGDYHSSQKFEHANGGITLAFQKWINSDKQFSAASNWKGFIRGKDGHQANLIRRVNGDNVFINDEVADVTRTL